MPRGVYDRTHLKSKKPASASTTSSSAATAKTSPAKSQAAKTSGTTAKAAGTTVSAAPHAAPQMDVKHLHTHLQVLTNTRKELGGLTHENPTMLSALDGEIAHSVASLRVWREAHFPSTIVEIKPPSVQAQSSGPQPIPQAGAQSAPPLPFTPSNVDQALRQPAPPSAPMQQM
jgi:hypothetical protein